jgi:formamidopyrimidine-DNA glycosylase
MPELPEVENYKRYIDQTCLKQKITALDCRDNRLLKQPKSDFEEALIDKQLTETERIGKYLFLKTTSDKVLVIHFGMTGRPHYYNGEENRHKYAHIQLSFDNGYHFGFENKRKFGWWNLTDTIEEFKNEHNLSDDARELSLEDFKASLSSRSTDIKKIIMDQSVCAGVGNWMADDILYQAKIHPKHKVEDMSENDIKAVFEALKNVIEVAINNEAHYADFPDYFLIHNRKDGGVCHHTGCDIEKIKVGGRTTYFSPGWQKSINN